MYDLCVIDAKNLAYRCEWIHRNLSTSSGIKTGMIFGVLNSLISLKRTYGIRSFVFCWDSLTNWRLNKYPWYKDGRSDPPSQSFIDQMNILHDEFLPHIGINQVEAETFEADDVASWIVRNWEGKKLLVSNDHDWLQLVNDTTHLLRPCKKKVYDLAEIRIEMNLSPVELPLYWSMIGDSCDNIKGIYRFYKKDAAILATECTSLDDLINKIKHGVCKRAIGWEERVRRNYEIICLLDIDVINIVGVRSVKDFSLFQQCCKKYEILSFLSRYGSLV